MRLPDFIIGGAPRSGTTWLYEMLDRHPRVHMARPVKPEPKFFLVDDIYAKGLKFYSDTWFAVADPNKLAGEKSTDYLESAAAAERIASDLPGVKLIFILREPVDRAFSNYLWSKMNRMETESFETALAMENERELALTGKLRFTRPFSYFSRGLYADLLAPYVKRFPHEQVLVVRFEDIVSAPGDLASHVHRFLGIAERPGDADGLGVINPSEKTGTLAQATRQELLERYAEPNRRLAALLGPDFPLW